MGEKYEITHTQTFFPESLIHIVVGRSPGLRLVVYLLIRRGRQWFVDDNKLISLQLRVQRKIFDF
ncbi:MAG: hypothetical protein ACI9WT_001013 [Flavobacterium sp.]|jgi:hypothetical protein